MSMMQDRGQPAIVNNVTRSFADQARQYPDSKQERAFDKDIEGDDDFAQPSSSSEDETDGPRSFFVQAQYAFSSTDNSSLSFAKDDVIEVLTQLPSGWWDGLLGLRRGWFPSNYVRRIEAWEAEAWFTKLAEEEEEEDEAFDPDDTRGADSLIEIEDDLEAEDEAEDVTLTTTSRAHPLSSRAKEADQPADLPLDQGMKPGIIDSPLPDDSPTESGVIHDGLSLYQGTGSQRSRGSGERQSLGEVAVGKADEEVAEEEEVGNVEDFWVPSMTQDGQIYYHNTKTQETAWEIPHIDSEEEDDLAGPEMSSFPAPKAPRRPLAVPPRGSSIDTIDPLDNSIGGVDNDFSPYGLRRRLSEIEEGSAGPSSGGQKKDKVVEMHGYGGSNMVHSTGVPLPAVSVPPGRPGMDRRPSEMSIESVNSFSMTGRRNGTTGSGKSKSRKGLGEALKAFGISRNPSLTAGPGQTMPFNAGGSSSSGHHANGSGSSGWKMDRFGAMEKAVKRLSGTPRSEHFGGPGSPVDTRASILSVASNGTSKSRSASVRKSQESSVDSARQRSMLVWEEEAIVRMERAANTEHAVTDLEQKVEDVTSALDEIIQASATYLSVFEAREVELSSGTGEVTRFKEADALRLAVLGITAPVRRLVQACRHAVLGLPAIVIETLLDIPSQVPTQDHALSFLSGEGLHPAQRRVVASLSKIVFSAHSAVGMDWPLQASAEKLGKDATDILGSIELFIHEVKTLGCLSETGRGVKQIEPSWGFGEVLAPRKRQWRRLDEQTLKLVDQLVSSMDSQVERLTTQNSDDLDDTDRRAQLEQAVALVENFESVLRNLDVAATLDLDESTAPSTPVESSPVTPGVDYSGLVTQAIEHKQAYEDILADTRSASSQLVWAMMQPEADRRSAELLLAFQATWEKAGPLLGDMANNATRQAEAIANGQAKGNIGRRSARVLEREKIARRMRSSSRSSSLASLQPFAPRRERGSQRYDEADNESLRSQDLNSQPFASRSNPSLHGRQRSVGRGGISASSSFSNLSAMNEMEGGQGGGSARSSTTQFMKGGMTFLRNRSASEVDPRHSPVQGNKKKLAKWLGEEEVSEILDPTSFKPQVEENPSYLAVDYSDNDVILYMDGAVKAGTLPALIERLTLHDRTDHSFNATFLMTYRSFASGVELVDHLTKRYSIQPPAGLTPEQVRDWQMRKQKPVKLRVFNIFKTWLDQYFNEEEDPEVLNKIEIFTEEVLAKDAQLKMPHQVLLRAVQRRRTDGDVGTRRLTVTTTQPPPPMIPKINSSRGVQLLDIEPEELARQLALFEANLYNRILPVDCLDTAWSRSNPENGANIKAMINTSNRMAAWVAQAILIHIDAKKRAQVMKYFLQVADHCRRHNNFSTVFAIMAGVDSTPIIRLKRTKEHLSAKSQALWESLDKTLDIGRKYAAYRELLKRINPPCIPFLGAYLTFLTAIEEGNANNLPCPTDPSRKLIHFAKRQKCADVIREIQQYQATPYTFISLPVVQIFIKERLENVENGPDAYELSLKLEPREREDEKIARMLRESVSRRV